MHTTPYTTDGSLSDGIVALLNEGRCETARRLCRRYLASATGEERDVLLLLLHQACRFLGDQAACLDALAGVESADQDRQLEVVLRRAEDFKYFGTGMFYRESEACAQGYSHWEYFASMQKNALEQLERARDLADTEARRRRLTQAMRFCGEGQFSEVDKSHNNIVAPASPERAGSCTLQGTLSFPGGMPAGNLTVTLGLQVALLPPDPRRYTNLNLEVYEPDHSLLETRSCQTDDRGRYCFTQLPAGTHEFLAVNLDPQTNPVAVRFLAHHILLHDGDTMELNADILAWQSSPSRQTNVCLPETIVWRDQDATCVATDVLRNPFDYAFPRQLLEIDLPPGIDADPDRLILLLSDCLDTPVPFQLAGQKLLYFCDLPPRQDRMAGLYRLHRAQHAMDESPLRIVEAGEGSALISTGKALFRVPWGDGQDLLPPIVQVKGGDDEWRGEGRLLLPEGVTLASRSTTLIEQGRLRLQIEIRYFLSNEMTYSFRLTFHRDEEYVLVHEICPCLPGAGFQFSLAEFMHGRYFLNEGPEGTRKRLWGPLTPGDRTLGLLKETISFGVPLEGFGLLMSKDCMDEKDCVGVFTIRRGEWIDRAFEKVCNGPAKADCSHEQEWPYPEMIGSTYSMIVAETADNDCRFRFDAFDGERHWGLMVSSFARNDGRFKALSEYQHKNSCPRLQVFKQWRLDLPDSLTRPSLLVQAERLPELRRRKDDPRFAATWKRIVQMRPNGGGQWAPSAAGAFRAMLDADPAAIWNKKRELVAIAGPHARSVLLGRDKTPEYSPVASRAVTPWIEDYDLIVATGVFEPAEEQLVRAHHMLMGHMYLRKDFMNWTFNARNANFEADRVDTVGVAGICFRDNPDGVTFIRHAQSRMARIIETYCTPGSGKWYENPACYYLTSLKCWTNLFLHMAHHGLMKIEDVPRMKEFLRWGIFLLTPPTPDYEQMRDGVTPGDFAGKRRIAPIGDHARIGPTIPENYALMAAQYRVADPEFADLLRWAYHASGADGDYHNQYLLFFANADEWMLSPPAVNPALPSRRLEGFGAILRTSMHRPNESCLLLKLGPGGYRYHNTEGSILFFADGKPLIYDGGEAGETWRHSTLSFHDTHTMLAPGHVERFQAFSGLGFIQGVSPRALNPGEPNYLNDQCSPESIAIGAANYHEPNPAVSRSLFWVEDDYLIMHDALNLDPQIATHWHLQVVADSHAECASGWRFKGRFGTDLQVVMANPHDAVTTIAQLPILDARPLEERFAMRHLQVAGKKGTRDYLAVLRPLPGTRGEIQASVLSCHDRTIGVRIAGWGIDDTLYVSRESFSHRQGHIVFRGRYAAVLERPECLRMYLLDGDALQYKDIVISSDGPAVSLVQDRRLVTIAATGKGGIVITQGNESRSFTVDGEARCLSTWENRA